MTRYSRGSPYGRKHATVFHLLYRIENGELVSLGLFETREKAEQDLALVNGPLHSHSGEWKIADLNCVSFGVIDGVVNRNEPLPELTDEKFLKLLEPEDESLWTDWQRDA
jgi:hypothetical protein